MPDTYGETYRVAFDRNLGLDAQQKDARIAPFVDAEFNYAEIGDSFTADNIEDADGQEVDDRFGDLPENDIAERRRVGHFRGWEVASRLGSNLDKARQAADPTNSKVMAMKAAIARRQDAFVMAGMLGTAYSGRNGTTANALPSAQKIAVNDHTFDAGTGDVPLTVSKVMLAKEMLDAAEIDGERHIAVDARSISHMLTDSQVTSADYNTVKALVAGEINTWLGFTWHRYERLLVDGSADKLCVAWVTPAVCFKQRTTEPLDVWKRKDKRPHWYAYAQVDQAVVRREDAGVVQIACDPN